MVYSSSTEVEFYGQIDSSNTQGLGEAGPSYANNLTYAVVAADRMIESYCDVPSGFFDAGGVTITTEYHDGVEVGYYGLYPSFGVSYKMRPKLRLNYTPVISVTTLEENTSGSTWTARTEGRSSDFIVVPDGVRFIGHVPRYDYDNVRVTYVAGYAAIPGNVVECSGRLAAAILLKIIDAKKRSPVSIGSLSTSPADMPSLSAEVFTPPLKDLVKRYRRRTPVRITP
jgi:hypothetical protein